MIKNERQYRITKSWAQKFAETLTRLNTDTQDRSAGHLLLHQAERDAAASQLETLQREMRDYEALRAGETQAFHLDSFEELPRTLIQARIARGLSQKELAGRLGLKEQQIQRYEATEYASASMERVSAVIQALGLTVREEVSLSDLTMSSQ